MTKAEYEAAIKYAKDSDREPWLTLALFQAKDTYIASLESENARLEKALHIADEEYMCATFQYYNEPVPPSNYHRWLSLAIDPPKEEK